MFDMEELEQTSQRLSAGAWVVVGLEHLQLVAGYQILSSKDYRRDLLLFNQPAQRLRVDTQNPGGFNKVHEVVKWIGDHCPLGSRPTP